MQIAEIQNDIQTHHNQIYYVEDYNISYFLSNQFWCDPANIPEENQA